MLLYGVTSVWSNTVHRSDISILFDSSIRSDTTTWSDTPVRGVDNLLCGVSDTSVRSDTPVCLWSDTLLYEVSTVYGVTPVYGVTH